MNMETLRKHLMALLILVAVITPTLFTSNVFAVTNVYVSGENVRVRSTPTTSSNSNIVGKVNKGDVCTVISEENGWTEVTVKGIEGYIRNDFLQAQKVQASPAISKKSEPATSDVEMVWIPTHGGKKIHSKSGCSGMDNPAHVTIDEAHRRGFYDYCKRCN